MISRRTTLKGLATIVASGLTTAAYGFGIEAPSTRITRYGLTPPRWLKGHKLKIAMIADPHVIEPWMGIVRLRSVVAATNALKPDMTLLLGDYAAGRQIRKFGSIVPPRAWAQELAALKAPLGVHAVLGNHDWWEDSVAQRRRAGPTEAHGALADAGIAVFENTAVRIAHNGAAFWLAGLGDQWAFFPKVRPRRWREIAYEGIHDVAGTLAQVTDDAPVIMMAHEPDIFATLPERVSLTVSGHTHGGQISMFGFTPVVPSRFGSRYAYGHIVEDNRHLIVSAGLGCSLLPMRIGAPPEIVEITLGV
jgi:uncharacterized protein